MGRLDAALLVLLLSTLQVGLCTMLLNWKARVPTKISVNNSQNLLPDWLPWDTHNFTADHFSTLPIGPGVASTYVDLTSFSFNLPKDSVLSGIVFSLEQCSMEVDLDWSLIGWLIRGPFVRSISVFASFTHALQGTTCFATEHKVQLGGEQDLWGLEDQDHVSENFAALDFGVRLQVQTEHKSRKGRQQPSENNNTTTIATTTTTATTNVTTSTSMSSSVATTSSSTAAPTTQAPTVKPAPIYFRAPKMTIYYYAPCGLNGINGFVCSNDGYSVLEKPVVVDSDLLIPASNVLVLRMNILRDNNVTMRGRATALSVRGRLRLAGKLILLFESAPQSELLETWSLFESTNSSIDGWFREVETKVAGLDVIDAITEKLCGVIPVGWSNTSSLVTLSTIHHNQCMTAAQNHPGVVAAIVLSVLGVFFTIIVLFVLWRKRRFERSRAAALSSPLAEEAELQEMRLADTKSYSEAAKMIETTSGRFEIGDDDIDDGHPEL